MERLRAYGYRPTPHCWSRAGRSQLWSASSFDVLVYAVVQAFWARSALRGHTRKEFVLMLAFLFAAVVLGLDSFNRSSGSPSLSAIVIG